MRPNQNMKRSRGQRRKQGPNVNRALDSTGPDVKIRGTAAQIYEKYSQLSRDAQSAGDRVKSENYLQHAEHYYRIMKSMQAAAQPNQNQPAQQPDAAGVASAAGAVDPAEQSQPETPGQVNGANGKSQDAPSAAPESGQDRPQKEASKEASDDSDAEAEQPAPRPRRRRTKRTPVSEQSGAEANGAAAEGADETAPAQAAEPVTASS